MSPYAIKDIWSTSHRFCEDTPVIEDLDEAKYVATTHAGHGGHCRQYLAAQHRVAEGMS